MSIDHPSRHHLAIATLVMALLSTTAKADLSAVTVQPIANAPSAVGHSKDTTEEVHRGDVWLARTHALMLAPVYEGLLALPGRGAEVELFTGLFGGGALSEFTARRLRQMLTQVATGGCGNSPGRV